MGDNLIDPSELIGPSVGRIIDRLGETDSPASRLIALEEEITRLIECSGSEPPGDIAWALRQIECRGGGVSIRSRPDLGLAAVAAACGYADQAHLTRDWRQFSGSPPRELLRRGLPDGGGWTD